VGELAVVGGVAVVVIPVRGHDIGSGLCVRARGVLIQLIGGVFPRIAGAVAANV
jgi:hypothetical protein